MPIIACLVVLVLLVPTVIWVRLRVRWMTRLIEALCLLPLTIPAIVLVVGLAPIYRVIRQQFSLSALQLFWVYAVLALPYAYRALAAGLDGVDVEDAVRGGAQPGRRVDYTVIWRVIVPNMRQGVLNAMLLTGALVLGELTIAYLLLYNNLQVTLFFVSRGTPNAGVLFSTSSAALLFAFVLLLILSFVGRRRGGQSERSKVSK